MCTYVYKCLRKCMCTLLEYVRIFVRACIWTCRRMYVSLRACTVRARMCVYVCSLVILCMFRCVCTCARVSVRTCQRMYLYVCVRVCVDVVVYGVVCTRLCVHVRTSMCM